jgi:hypothetical protein
LPIIGARTGGLGTETLEGERQHGGTHLGAEALAVEPEPEP